MFLHMCRKFWIDFPVIIYFHGLPLLPHFPFSLHFSVIIRPSQNHSSIPDPSPSSAIAVNPQANLLSISIRRVVRQLNICAFAQHCVTPFSLSLLPVLLPRRTHADTIGFTCPFLSFFLLINRLWLDCHAVHVSPLIHV